LLIRDEILDKRFLWIECSMIKSREEFFVDDGLNMLK
jgi:hypothetical protein